MNPNIKLNFQVCINVPLSLSIKYGQKLLHITKKGSNTCTQNCLKKSYPKSASKIPENITKATLKSTCEGASKLPVPADKTSVQPIGTPKENYILTE